MNNRTKINIKWTVIFTASVCFLVIVILIYFLYQLYLSKEYCENEARIKASENALLYAESIDDGVKNAISPVELIAAGVPQNNNIDILNEYGHRMAAEYKINCLQFLKGYDAILRFGDNVGSSTAEEVVSLIAKGKTGCSEIYQDRAMGVNCVAIYVPVHGNDNIDGAIAYYAVLDTLLIRKAPDSMIKYYCLCDKSGAIIESYSAEGFKTGVSHNIYEYMNTLGENKDLIDTIRVSAQKRISRTFDIIIDTENCIVASVLIDSYGTDCYVYTVYNSRDIVQSEYEHYDKMVASAVILAVLSLISLVVFVINIIRTNEKKIISNDIDPVLLCNTYSKFIFDAMDILSRNKNSNFAILYIDINKFSYLKEHFEPGTSEETLRFIGNVIKKISVLNETYGHIIDDRFVRLIHFVSEQELSDKILLMQALAANFPLLKNTSYTLKLSVGVYLVDKEKDKGTSLDALIERASTAHKIDKKTADMPFVIFNANIRSDYQKEAEIEAKMDLALQNREFKVFYQPKYNIAKDRIDSAEALVRWYDEKLNKYVFPSDFIPIFEVNGFIVRLDRYVYVEVCSYLYEAVKRGEKVVPIAVNVSRVSATQPDFTKFYIETKKKYSIPDNFITVEFTESFACENNETIAKIVSTLSSNGFICSVDDFGSGYSSLSVLKELKMDELKLDVFFIKQGTDKKRDETLLKTIIDLGKSLGMKVTQEGVETNEDLKRMMRLGCDVIQGYLYSKPIQLSDFIGFISGDTSLRGIANKRKDF